MKHNLLICMMLVMLAGCSGGSVAQIEGQPISLDNSLSASSGVTLGLLRNTSGVPQGVRISWSRVDIAGVLGYYIYRDMTNIPAGDPAAHSGLRIDADGNSGGGNGMYAQTGTGTETLTFDDVFAVSVGDSYFYRLTVVNSDSDESDFSNEETIAILLHVVDTVAQTDGSIGATVTITGQYFGSDRSGDKVFFADSLGAQIIEAATYESWSPTQIEVTVPYGAADGLMTVEIGGVGVNSPLGQLFDYDEPAITLIDPVEDYVQNEYISLTGTDFGPVPSTVGDETKIFFGVVPAQPADINEATWSDTNIDVMVPAAAIGDEITVYVSVAGSESDTVDFTLLPHIDSFGADNPEDYQGVVGDSLTINGTNFGASQGAGEVMFGGVSASTFVTSWANGAVTITVPDWALDGVLSIKRDDGNETNSLAFDVIPELTGFTPSRRLIGETVTITGSGFGDDQGSSTVTFDGGAGIVVTDYTWSNNIIEVVVPDSALTGTLTVEIDDDDTGGLTLDSVTSVENLIILLDAPVIEDIGQL